MSIFSYLLIIINLFLVIYCDDTTQCRLTKSAPINVKNKDINKYIIIQPFPNLKKCYKHNEAACCNIINDNYIKDYIESYIPEDCLRLFPELEDLLCYGCHENEAKFRSSTNEIRICKSFAKKIWKAELDKPSTRFDGCGLLAKDNNFEGFDQDLLGYIIPSKVFNDFEHFINALQIPYYDDSIFTIKVVEDGNNCFNNNNAIKMNKLIFLFIMIFILF